MRTLDDLIEVRWYCGAYTSVTLGFAEPDECGHTFTTIEARADWAENVCMAKCPKCQAILSQAYDHPEPVWLLLPTASI